MAEVYIVERYVQTSAINKLWQIIQIFHRSYNCLTCQRNNSFSHEVTWLKEFAGMKKQ